jgi:hypothetical protein
VYKIKGEIIHFPQGERGNLRIRARLVIEDEEHIRDLLRLIKDKVPKFRARPEKTEIICSQINIGRPAGRQTVLGLITPSFFMGAIAGCFFINNSTNELGLTSHSRPILISLINVVLESRGKVASIQFD